MHVRMAVYHRMERLRVRGKVFVSLFYHILVIRCDDLALKDTTLGHNPMDTATWLIWKPEIQ